MYKNLFVVEDSEKNRILESHKKATVTQYLIFEQDTKPWDMGNYYVQMAMNKSLSKDVKALVDQYGLKEENDWNKYIKELQKSLDNMTKFEDRDMINLGKYINSKPDFKQALIELGNSTNQFQQTTYNIY